MTSVVPNLRDENPSVLKMMKVRIVDTLHYYYGPLIEQDFLLVILKIVIIVFERSWSLTTSTDSFPKIGRESPFTERTSFRRKNGRHIQLKSVTTRTYDVCVSVQDTNGTHRPLSSRKRLPYPVTSSSTRGLKRYCR